MTFSGLKTGFAIGPCNLTSQCDSPSGFVYFFWGGRSNTGEPLWGITSVEIGTQEKAGFHTIAMDTPIEIQGRFTPQIAAKDIAIVPHSLKNGRLPSFWETQFGCFYGHGSGTTGVPATFLTFAAYQMYTRSRRPEPTIWRLPSP